MLHHDNLFKHHDDVDFDLEEELKYNDLHDFIAEEAEKQYSVNEDDYIEEIINEKADYKENILKEKVLFGSGGGDGANKDLFESLKKE